MNKRSGKTNGLAQRLLALLLCCVCLVAIMPVYAIASDAEAAAAADTVVTAAENETDKQPVDENKIDNTSAEIKSEDDEKNDSTTSENTEVTEDKSVTDTGDNADSQSFYDEVMTSQSCTELYMLIGDDDNYERASALTVEQVYAIRDYAQTMEDDGYQEPLVAMLNELLKSLGENIDSEYATDLTGEIAPSMYKNSVPVYWDTATKLAADGQSAGNTTVSTVTLGGSNVIWGNSDNTSWSSGSTLATYFPNASAGEANMKDATLSITAAAGYYVTGVVVACAPNPRGTAHKPFDCKTWAEGHAFTGNFDLSKSAYSKGVYTLSITINSKYFSHNGSDTPNAYFILITTAKVPTPLYVEYDYGDVASFLTVDANSAFNSPTWTVANSGNEYGSGETYQSGVLTKDTQFAYQYPGTDTSVIASWVHKANAVSDAALKEAAANGYYFAGWEATWYNTCTVTNIKDSHNDDYTMQFSNVYGTIKNNIAPGDNVQLPTNVRLVAQWKPIELKMTKTVEGLANIVEHKSAEQTYKLTLQKLNESGEYVNLQTDVEYAITGDGTLTKTFAATGENVVTQAITPGTYRVVENGDYDITGKAENAYCTTTYPVETVVVSEDGTVSGDLQVLNTYSSKPAAYSLTIAKTVSGNMADTSKEFTFKVTIDSVDQPTFTLKHGQSTTISVPVGAEVSVTEDRGGYEYSLKSITGITVYTDNKENGISFTMPNEDSTVTFNNNKDVSIDTGVTLDSLPYILILAVVVAGAVIVLRKRRSRDED